MILFFYCFVVGCMSLYGLHCYVLLLLFVIKFKKKRTAINEVIEAYWQSSENIPYVTIQIPIYNEKDVVERVIESACQVEYPHDKLEIQILDDSNDETVFIIDKFIKGMKEKYIQVELNVIRRENRFHFKAGALAEGVRHCKGEFVAIFDADFLIPKNFLIRAIAIISQNAEIACVQGRWEHLNANENWMTKALSIGIDGHFTIDQGARSYNQLALNFNGTAGLWRVSSIKDAGGWQGDTLTEDLDLSYRAQMLGYKIVYDFDNVCPAEIPNNIWAIKSQQKRWAKGSMQTAMKIGKKILFCKNFKWYEKLESFFHLTHYSVSLFMLLACILLVHIIKFSEDLSPFLQWAWIFIIISAIAPSLMYFVAGIYLKRKRFTLNDLPKMIVLGSGLCLNNSIAILEALFHKKSDFIRTPKSGSLDQEKKYGSYRAKISNSQSWFELILFLYVSYALIFSINQPSGVLSLFLIIYALGFGCLSIPFLKRKTLDTHNTEPRE